MRLLRSASSPLRSAEHFSIARLGEGAKRHFHFQQNFEHYQRYKSWRGRSQSQLCAIAVAHTMSQQKEGSTKRLKARAEVNEQKAKELITRESALQLHESNSFTESLRQVLESIYVALFIVLLIVLDTAILMDNIITVRLQHFH